LASLKATQHWMYHQRIPSTAAAAAAKLAQVLLAAAVAVVLLHLVLPMQLVCS
jgi:hypothetical protein